MLLDILIQSVNEFQSDCMALCNKHYPAIHNQGMTEHHLGKAFSRRLERTLVEFGHTCESHPVELHIAAELPHHFRVSSDIGTVWILTHHMVSANKASKDKIFRDITLWKNEYGYAIQPTDILLLLADHWMTRDSKSRELLYWWTGKLPDEMDAYNAQGIALHKSDSKLLKSLESIHDFTPCYIKYTHPLKRSKDQQLVRRYIQLYTVLQ
ncbi:hypothetical protein VA7868_03216 [Vibrio aerogenes CECT 7868]|uniref:Uncharacterized protein n=1 Tax=Vibrio aerogenes CECT 7868 TaxID=1216006 RepID=A0A1M5ZTU6_9VIBR|nr:hypothetical protein [Vibrio aerogenes]SHI27644.1 hypothetical protein VA7868_03216 [Vibrio aerogenes CECT 7868]